MQVEIEKLRKFAPSFYGNDSSELTLSTIDKVSVGGGGVSASDEVTDHKKEVIRVFSLVNMGPACLIKGLRYIVVT